MADKQSKCVFCNSTSYGKNCPWSHFKNKIHLHTGDGLHCSFCGSANKVGPGCPHSPTGKHMASANFFNGMASESFIIGYMMNVMSTPIHETQAFKLGLVDASGAVIKRPSTLDEHMAFTPIDSYLFKLKNMLGPKKDLLNTEIYLEAVTRNAELPIELYEKEVKMRNDMKIIANRFNEMLTEATEQGLPLMSIQKVILETMLGI